MLPISAASASVPAHAASVSAVTVAAIAAIFILCLPLIKKISATFLLLSKWPAPCDHAARANPEGAKLSFAFVFRRLKYQSILFQPHQKDTHLLVYVV